ncbi:hemicentin-1 [Galendromus occidentalis]|uniref:Hemicentin-1 n=1 Tax=Galendromus occidentalis TaxID=34638 RepID=A0AAJ7WI72_9ACAR|nr:hemicentin-1 [Galendromus occidentalis]
MEALRSTGLTLLVAWGLLLATAEPRRQGNQLQERVVNPGERISIPCFLETPGGSIQWVRNGHPVVLDATTSSRRQWNISKDGTAALSINQVTRADDGLWECWEFADDGSVKRVAKVLKLVVTGAPEEPFLVQNGKRIFPGDSVVAKENQTVTVECVARRAVPEVKQVFWSLGPDGVNVTAKSDLKVDFISHEDSYTTRSVLTLNTSRAMNHQRISCHVFHVAWPNATVVNASLNVLYPPTFSISRIPGFGHPVVEKSFVSLECIIDANPPSTPHWSKDDRAINSTQVIRQGGGFLNFTSADRNHSGWYRCTTQHPMGTFASFGYLLSIRFGPEMMDDTPKEIHADFGEPVRLECQAKGKPLPSYCWSRKQPGRIAEGLTSDSTLVLDPVVYQDAGTYQCTASNLQDWKRQRNAIREVQLSITGRPDVSALNSSMVGIIGQSMWITVHVCANPQPSRSHWLLGHHVMSPGDKPSSHSHYIAHPFRSADTPFCRYASLEITQVRSSDAGEFLFVARNDRGIDDAAINVTVVKSAFGYHSNFIPHSRPTGVRSEMSRPVMATANSGKS